MARKKTTKKKSVETLTHDDKRKNIPTAEYQPIVQPEYQRPTRVEFERRNRDLDPQLVWRGKDEQDWSDLVVHTAPLYIQEKVHPKVLIDDLLRQTKQKDKQEKPKQLDLFADFNGVPEGDAKTEFYQHDANWTNRMILGDSLQVMASLAEREGLRGQVQCIFMDPPYGIKFNSNFQWSTRSREVKDGKAEHITREPEQVKAFRDTWRDGIHSYLTYLRDRLTAARDLLADSGSIFMQIGDENVHHVRSVMDEVFGVQNRICLIAFAKTATASSSFIPSTFDYLIWYGRNRESTKFRAILREKSHRTQGASEYYNYMDDYGFVRRLSPDQYDDREIMKRSLRIQILTSQTGNETTTFNYEYQGKTFSTGTRGWSTNIVGMERLNKAHRMHVRTTSLNYVRFLNDYPVLPLNNRWDDTAIAGWSEDKRYVVQTARRVIERCLLLATDPGDLVLDPTCGSGTSAYVAEQWGRWWITIDTSRVALALARARIMGARYPYYLLADSREGQQKEADVTRSASSEAPTYGRLRQGFVYERVPHITLKSIANNAEIDVIWDKFQETLEALRKSLNKTLKQKWEEWEIPREAGKHWKPEAVAAHQAIMAHKRELKSILTILESM